MTTGLLAGCLAAAALWTCRVRPDHRVRDTAAMPNDRPRPLRRRRRRPRRAGPGEIAAWCDALARDVRSGRSLTAALRSVAPPEGTPLERIPLALARGKPLLDALDVPAASPDEQAALTVLAACAHHGGPAAQPLDQVAATLRRRAADEAERAVHSAQARLSAQVMTVLPGAVLVLLLATSPSTRAATGSPFGVATVAIGLGLNVLGWLWMRRIIAGRRG